MPKIPKSLVQNGPSTLAGEAEIHLVERFHGVRSRLVTLGRCCF
jgi:hypothetical protein